MTKSEFIKVIEVLIAIYPNSKLDLKNTSQISMWYEMLNDLELDKLLLAIKKMATIEHFSPSIAKIREHYASIVNPIKIDDSEGWGLVMKAIRTYGYTRADEAMESLPKEVRKAVQYIGGFKMICESEEPDVVRGQFFRAMQAVNSSEKEKRQMNADIRDITKQIAEKMKMPEVEIEKTLEICGGTAGAKSKDGISRVKSVLNKVLGKGDSEN